MKCRNSTKTQKWARIPQGVLSILCLFFSVKWLQSFILEMELFSICTPQDSSVTAPVFICSGFSHKDRPSVPQGLNSRPQGWELWPCSGQVFDPGVGVRVQGRNSQQQFRVPREGRIVMILADTPCGEGGKQQLFCFNKHVLSTSHVPGPGQGCGYKNKCSQFCLQRV